MVKPPNEVNTAHYSKFILLLTIGSLIIEISVIIVMGDKSLNFNNSDGCNNSDA